MILLFYFQESNQEKWKQICIRSCREMLVSALFVIIPNWKQPNNRQMDKQIEVYTNRIYNYTYGYIIRIMFSFKREKKWTRNTARENFKISVHEKIQRKDCTLHASTHMECPEKATVGTEIWSAFASGQKWGLIENKLEEKVNFFYYTTPWIHGKSWSYPLKSRWILWYVSYTSMKIFKMGVLSHVKHLDAHSPSLVSDLTKIQPMFFSCQSVILMVLSLWSRLPLALSLESNQKNKTTQKDGVEKARKTNFPWTLPRVQLMF